MINSDESRFRFLPWDTEFFGKRIGRVEGSVLDDSVWEAACAWSRREDIDCLYVATPVHHPTTRRIASHTGVVLADVRLELERTGDLAWPAPGPAAPEIRSRLGRPTDIPALQAIASGAHTQSRFYQDPNLCHRAPDLFRLWLQRSFEGFADAVWVAEQAGVPVGYVTCSQEKITAKGSIGLVGVAEAARGHGVAQALMAAVLGWFAERHITTISLVTQGSNLGAQRLYFRLGFLPRAIDLWFHCWF